MDEEEEEIEAEKKPVTEEGETENEEEEDQKNEETTRRDRHLAPQVPLESTSSSQIVIAILQSLHPISPGFLRL